MKRSITLLLLFMTAVSSLVLAHKHMAQQLETKRREEAVEDDGHEVEKELEEELEAEMSGFNEKRHLGFHILDEDSNIIISEPTDRILRLLGPDRDPDGHILRKIKDLYGKRLSAEHSARNSHSANTNINFIEMLAREQDANKKSNGEQDYFIKHLVSMVF
ncbi:uncharacterized protein [Cherax quadricarinatus]|nr:uncharacterized protein LOC128691157 isoform X2 [Cherax quadricarinatus]